MPCTVKGKPLEKVCLCLAVKDICREHCDIMLVTCGPDYSLRDNPRVRLQILVCTIFFLALMSNTPGKELNAMESSSTFPSPYGRMRRALVRESLETLQLFQNIIQTGSFLLGNVVLY